MRTTGNDLTIVGSGAGMPAVMEATQQLQKAGMKVEAIDLRSLKPMDTETLVKSVQKTKRLLTFDQSYYTLCPGAEVIARVAENVDGARYKRIAFPDAPPPASPEMFTWMRPNAGHIVAAAKKGGWLTGVSFNRIRRQAFCLRQFSGTISRVRPWTLVTSCPFPVPLARARKSVLPSCGRPFGTMTAWS